MRAVAGRHRLARLHAGPYSNREDLLYAFDRMIVELHRITEGYRLRHGSITLAPEGFIFQSYRDSVVPREHRRNQWPVPYAGRRRGLARRIEERRLDDRRAGRGGARLRPSPRSAAPCPRHSAAARPSRARSSSSAPATRWSSSRGRPDGRRGRRAPRRATPSRRRSAAARACVVDSLDVRSSPLPARRSVAPCPRALLVAQRAAGR